MSYNHKEIVNKLTGLIQYVSSCSKEQDLDSLTGLLDELLNIGTKMCSEGKYESEESMRTETYKTFVSLAGLADEDLPKNPTMDLVYRIFSERGVDIGDYKIYKNIMGDPDLN
ncbi:MAG: hypothetical protein DRP06_01525 [Candidatus Aenigmatarchaeota archaeon]|nr:MAG: hypothetical protein DRP06_01525 [Candidatus Aenigmarchaeota archaeon]